MIDDEVVLAHEIKKEVTFLKYRHEMLVKAKSSAAVQTAFENLIHELEEELKELLQRQTPR